MQIAIIHVTDIHFTTNSDYNARALPFCQAVTSSIRGINKIYFVLSGDIAFSGSEDEYEIAIKYFSICKQLLKQENKNLEIKFVIVPGNHDCSFNGDTHLRRNIVASMNYKILGNDNSVIDECTKIQSNFWNFYSKYNQIPEDKLFYKINDVVEQKQIAFYCINTAWMSSIDEKAGTLFFPVKRYHEFERGLNEISFGVWHHPYNWFNPSTSENNKKEFELFTESISETHFFGHEHQQSFYDLTNRNNDVRINLLSGRIFNEDKKPKNSGFQILVIDLNDKSATLKKFDLDGKIYRPTEKTVVIKEEKIKKFVLNPSFLESLESIKIPLSIEGKKNVKLSDVFIFPDLDYEKSLTRSLENHINSKRLLEKDFTQCIIDGESQVGKSSLLSQLFLNLYEDSYVPILLTGIDIRDTDLDKIIKKKFSSQYSAESDFDQFYQLDKNKLALLIDDFHESGLNSIFLKEFINQAELRFGKIILTIDAADIFSPKIKSEVNNYKSYTIKPLGFKLRNDLIERYQYLKPDAIKLHDQDRLNIIKQKFDDVQAILGDKFIPSYPLFILGILQALEYKPTNLNETSFGYCYQALILYSLYRVGVTNDEIDTYFNFLTELAYEFIKRNKNTFNDQELHSFYQTYQEKFITPPYEKIFGAIKKAKILVTEMEEYKFGYNYLLYYLSAKKISDLLHTEIGKKIINELFKNVHIEKNASILVFIAHHSKDVSYIEESILNAMLALENSTAITLNKNDPFYNSLYSFGKEITNDVLETNRNPKTQREQELIFLDNEQRIKELNAEETFNEINEVAIPFYRAFRSIEIVGQIVKNRKGSLEKPQLLQMIEEIYTTGFRIIAYTIDLLESTKINIIKAISEEIDSTTSRYEIEQKVNEFIQINNLQVCLGVFIKLANSIGTKELKNIYVDAANKLNTPAARLVSFGINSYYGTISDKELISLVKDFKDNHLALNILRARVKSYVYNRDLDYKSKQRFASILGMHTDTLKAFNKNNYPQDGLRI